MSKGLKSAPNATWCDYRARVVANLGAGVNIKQLAQAACNTMNVADPSCEDVLLLALTHAKYSSNTTANTPGRRAFISPAQVPVPIGLMCSRAGTISAQGYVI
jgi:hypothetical protein